MRTEVIDALVGLKSQLKDIYDKISASSKSIEEAQINLKPLCGLEIEIEKVIKKINSK
ncbi:hypothetical protein K5I29_02280 [Flavobacterium agricola]|uniref:Uncharacterized protein n=1 Tax=Flavobacterium agricola TaxID=2870839 RepID=A0ABY6M0H4_9FLAO|nr:hypothetical protein [Flavobacterium agricola]UYW01772.1 hypothetical protein K5I29_02280 [Flavobacterium agricola]